MTQHNPFMSLSPEQREWLDATFARNRDLFAGFSMEANGGDGGGAGGGDGGDPAGGGAAKTFTQDEVDQLIGRTRQEERRKVAEKFADYDDLKAKAGTAATLEERLTELETKGTQAEQRALRAEIAGEFGISTKRGEKGEPSDADLFLTGTDEATLRKQAERLAGHASERKKAGNHVPREGQNPTEPAVDGKRAWLRSLKQD